MSQYITKTLYLEYQACGKNAWLKLHKPEVQDMFKLSEFEQGLLEKGNQVEEYARKLFPNGVLVETFGIDAANATRELVGKKTLAIFQATFISGIFLARNDILQYDAEGDSWSLCEVKGTNSLNDAEDGRDHIDDAAFQVVVMSDLGIKISKVTIIHLNKEYLRGDNLDVAQLFTRVDVTQQVTARLAATREKMGESADALTQLDEKALTCECIYVGRSAQCTTFCYSHPDVPEYSVHDLTRIGASKKKLEELIDSGIFDIRDVPDDFPLSEAQKNQALAHKIERPIVDVDAIRKELEALTFPLFFLDYETYPSPIPLFKGYRPYQQVPFQFSIDLIKDADGAVEHFEYLHIEASDPSAEIVARLREIIGFDGTVIAWHKSFEKMINEQMAERNPEQSRFLDELNNRVYDLKDIFSKQLHVHPGFRGKTSIKNVLPILVPSLNYKELEIQNGGDATVAWHSMVYGDRSADQKAEIATNLLKYCGRDTAAMVAIWNELRKIAS